ncbi:hypothetical protein PMAC_001555 [Pneumocystis sp. 'macacae']|nr:hypothetical protein PMAC_001555 [Pneumocystis sp. 'macacae']
MPNVQNFVEISDFSKQLKADFNPCNSQNSVNNTSSITRCRPNILICGTPGTGKTTHALRLRSLYDLHHLSVGDIVKKNKCHEGKNKTWDAYIVDETKTALKPFREGYTTRRNLVVVLRTQHTLLWDRLLERKYTLRKIQENNEAEIMQIVLDEAVTSFGSERVMELTSDILEQVDNNIIKIGEWIKQWQYSNKSENK